MGVLYLTEVRFWPVPKAGVIVVPLTVRRTFRVLPETLAQIFHPLPRPLPRYAYLRLFDALFAVGAFLSSLSCLPASVFSTASIATSIGSPLRSDRIFDWRISTSFAISATL